jgi:CheY-like chemotaxis protein
MNLDFIGFFQRLRGDSGSTRERESSPSSSRPTQTPGVVQCRRKTTSSQYDVRQFAPISSAATNTNLPTPGPFQGTTVLLVDDNAINQNIGARMLVTLGCRVYVAHNGEDALKQVRVCAGIVSPPPFSSAGSVSAPPMVVRSKSTSSMSLRRAVAPDPIHVVLMDYQMPIMDGVTATKEIRDMENVGELVSRESKQYFGKRWSKRLIIVAATLCEGDEIREAFVDAGIDGFTKKPFSVDSLRETLEMAAKMHDTG